MGKINRFLLILLMISVILFVSVSLYEKLYDIRYEETVNTSLENDILYIYRRYDRWTGEIKVVANGYQDGEWKTVEKNSVYHDLSE